VAYTVLFDACVLYSSRVRDLLLSLAETDLFRARWTEAINDEWVRNLKADRPELRADKIDRTRQSMNENIIDCLIFGYESLIPYLTDINQKDRHVVAAAILGRVDVIVTYDLGDFPKNVLGRYRIDVQHPDQFVLQLIDSYPGIVCNAIRTLRTGLKKPPMDPQEYLSSLEKAKLPESAALLRLFLTAI
jgi:PIN domain